MPQSNPIRQAYEEIVEYTKAVKKMRSKFATTDAAKFEEAEAMCKKLNKILDKISGYLYHVSVEDLQKATDKLRQTTENLSKTIRDIADIVEGQQKFELFANIFDSVAALAANILKVV